MVGAASGTSSGVDRRGRSTPVALPSRKRTVASADMADLSVRLVERRDAEAIRAIYNVEVAESTVTFDMVPRTLDEQVAWIDEHSGGHPAIVAVDGDGSVIGFGSLSPWRERPAYAGSVEDSVYVHRDHRGRGVGRLLLEELVRLGRDHGFHTVIARIVGGHEASIALHAVCGFDQVGIEREVGRKFKQWLDVVLMQRIL
jgi:L-amino acid N-acyltransferase YncA